MESFMPVDMTTSKRPNISHFFLCVFTIGGEKCRVRSLITINIRGERTDANRLGGDFGSKGIYVARDALISLHVCHVFYFFVVVVLKIQSLLKGQKFSPTWTRLRASAEQGSSTLELQDSVNWQAGQEIVIATTIMEDLYANENERRIIVGVSPDQRTLLLDKPLTYAHYGGAEYQAEGFFSTCCCCGAQNSTHHLVGLLSRRITIASIGGEADSFGAHVLIQGRAQINGVRLQKMGQLVSGITTLVEHTQTKNLIIVEPFGSISIAFSFGRRSIDVVFQRMLLCRELFSLHDDSWHQQSVVGAQRCLRNRWSFVLRRSGRRVGQYDRIQSRHSTSTC
jgi:hypothetical protein